MREPFIKLAYAPSMSPFPSWLKNARTICAGAGGTVLVTTAGEAILSGAIDTGLAADLVTMISARMVSVFAGGLAAGFSADLLSIFAGELAAGFSAGALSIFATGGAGAFSAGLASVFSTESDFGAGLLA